MVGLSVIAAVAALGCGRKTAQRAATSATASATAAPQEAALEKDTAAGATSDPAEDKRKNCDKCRERWCANFEGVDLVSGCFQRPDPKLVPNADAQFSADCEAVMKCAFEHDCGYDPARGPVQCYCGSRFVDECLKRGPAKDAPCVAEWQAAARSKDNEEVLLRFDQTQYPSGWAFHLMQCDRERCGANSPLGRCTP